MDPAQAFEAAEVERYSIINETIARGDSRVQQFYDGAVVFVTGGSGFLGKQLIEKLFRSTRIKKIYMLLRPKKKNTIADRMKKIADDSVYDTLRKTQPDFAQKIVPVMGDVMQPNLGISQEDWNTITEEVTLIFHGAATINFVEPLRVAALTNIRGTQCTIELAKACKNLRSFVHISTAYAHATRSRFSQPVLEQFYTCPVSPNIMLSLVEDLDDKKLDAITPELIQDWPNTYAFTKAIAEELVRTSCGDLPVCIVRPAIVISACREPSPGWIDFSCAYGPTGFVLGSGLGVLHVLYADPEINLDIVPVDLTNNAIIVAAHETVERRKRGENDIQIYTVTGTNNPLSLGGLAEGVRKSRDFATDKSVWYAFCYQIKDAYLYWIMTWLLHYIPGYLIDGILKIIGMKPMLMKVYEKVYKLNNVLGYFMTNNWLFGESNLKKLYSSLSPADRTIYNCDMATIDWDNYARKWCLGTRKYIIKDNINRTNVGNRKQFWFRILNAIVSFLYAFAMYKLIYFFYCVIYFVIAYLFNINF